MPRVKSKGSRKELAGPSAMMDESEEAWESSGDMLEHTDENSGPGVSEMRKEFARRVGSEVTSLEDLLSKPFDSKKARATMEELMDIGGFGKELSGLLSEFRSVAREQERLRTSGAAEALREYRTRVEEERMRERAAVDALQADLERTRAERDRALGELHALRTEPPAPSSDDVRTSDLYRRVATELKATREELQDTKERAAIAERDRDDLQVLLDRRGVMGEAPAPPAESIPEDAALVELFTAMTGLSAEKVGDEAFRIAYELDGVQSSFIIQYPVTDDVSDVTLTADENPHLLPECLREGPIACEPSDIPIFIRDLLSTLIGEDSEDSIDA